MEIRKPRKRGNKLGRKEERRGSKRGKTGRVESAIWGRVAKRGTSRNAKARSAKMKGGKKNKNQIKEQERQRKQRKKPLSRRRRRLPNLTKTTKRRLDQAGPPKDAVKEQFEQVGLRSEQD